MKTQKKISTTSNTPKIIPNKNWCPACGVIVQLGNKYVRREHNKGKRHQRCVRQLKVVHLDE